MNMIQSNVILHNTVLHVSIILLKEQWTQSWWKALIIQKLIIHSFFLSFIYSRHLHAHTCSCALATGSTTRNSKLDSKLTNSELDKLWRWLQQEQPAKIVALMSTEEIHHSMLAVIHWSKPSNIRAMNCRICEQNFSCTCFRSSDNALKINYHEFSIADLISPVRECHQQLDICYINTFVFCCRFNHAIISIVRKSKKKRQQRQ